eukprot:TRINITY_DN1442_c0_g1_i1.p1 TRINITY_DN1442_c0_g1~~TRINITY_DN1442_c0_g1_i1.p1  ORF type:complete len:221 (+),score=94.66 TRINITY_DN1442_c0_g1_i1:67-663(+)
MSEDWDDDSSLEDDDLDDVCDDWLEKEEMEEEELAKRQGELERRKADKAAKAKARQERIARRKAAEGEVADDDDIGEVDEEAKKRLIEKSRQFEIKQEMGGESDYADLPVEKMQPATKGEYEILGKKIGESLSFFKSSRHFPFAVGLLLARLADRMSLEDAQQLERKMGYLVHERTRVIKKQQQKKKVGPKDKEKDAQ